ncbi:MAG: phosphotriesterase [Eubacteriales bacterium]|nr:phosphotriesterase [Eubacteriales bacterium]
MKVNTVLGPVDSSKLGKTLMHEHILCANWTARMSYPGWINHDEVVELAVRMLRAVKACGFQTIVDCTPPGLGRDIAILREVSEKAEMNIIASTGFYWYEEVWLVCKDIKRMADRLIQEAERGIQGTDSKAGIIKCATDKYGLSENNKRLLEMTARVYEATGLPVYTHTSIQNRVAPAQQEYLMELGIPAERMVIGHLGDTDDLEFIESVLKKGSYAGLDRFGLGWIFPDDKRIHTLAELVKRGYRNQLVLSHDCSVFIDEFDNEWEERKNVDLNTLQFQYTHLPKRIVPKLLEAGLTEEDIDVLFRKVPRDYFEQRPA